jgi:DNA-binding winged helix-turn-helix (wHTH) protein/tetratricopeptide (TPR) repeat protein
MQGPGETPKGDFYEFGPFGIDVSKRSLLRGGEFVPLTPKVFDTLLALVEESGRVVTKAELLDRVWPAAFVEEGSITQNIFVLRKVLDPYFPETPIATVPRRGYRFTAGVRLRNPEAQVIIAEPSAVAAGPQEKAPPKPIWEQNKRWLVAGAASVVFAALIFVAIGLVARPGVGDRRLPRRSIAVLSLKDLAGQPEFAWLSTALAETLTTELGASPELRMVSGENVALIHRELSLPATTVLTPKTLGDLRRNLACDLVLTGSYLPLHGQIRLDVKLIDTASGEIIAIASQTDDEKNLLALVSRTGGLLRSKLGIGPLENEQSRDLRVLASSNREAMRFYFEGLTSLRQHDGPAAQKSLLRAVAADPSFPLAHSTLSAAWQLLGYEKNAQEEAKRAFDLAGRLSREERLRVEAQYYQASSDWSKAAETYQSLWRFFPDNIEYALSLGTVEFYLNKPDEMLRIADVLRTLPPPTNADPRIDLMESTAAHQLSDYPRALRAASHAAQEAASRKALLLLASAHLKEGNNTDFLGKPDKAREYYAAAARLYESVGDLGQAAYTLRLDAEVLVRQGQLEKAEEELAKALAVTRRIGFQRMTARVLLGYGNLERQRGNLASARRMFEEALALTRQTEDQTILPNLLNSYGHALRLEGDARLARVQFEEDLRIARAAGNRGAVSEALTSIATLDASLGNLAAARAGLDEGVALKRQLANPNSLALALSQLAAVLRMQGDLSGARKTVEEQCSIREALHETRQLAVCRVDLADLSIETAQPSEIRVTLDKILAEPGGVPSGSAALNKIARLWLAAGNPRRARETIAKAATDVPENAIPLTITAARIDASEGRSKQAIELLTRAEAEAAKFNYVPLVLEARLALAECGSHSQLLELAADAQRSGFGLIAAKARALSARTAS